MAEPLVRTMRMPKKKRMIMMGSSQNFLRTVRNPHKSLRKPIVNLLRVIDQYGCSSSLDVTSSSRTLKIDPSFFFHLRSCMGSAPNILRVIPIGVTMRKKINVRITLDITVPMAPANLNQAPAIGLKGAGQTITVTRRAIEMGIQR
jgi:hypothetical protein